MQWQEIFNKLPAGEKVRICETEAKRQYALKSFEVASQFRKLAEEAKQHASNN